MQSRRAALKRKTPPKPVTKPTAPPNRNARSLQLDDETSKRVNRFMKATRDKFDRLGAEYTFTSETALLALIRLGLDGEGF